MNKTLKNLALAFIGESQARNRYTFYSKVAKKEGFEQIAEIFLLTAEQEKTHAKRLFEHINELTQDEKIAVEAVAPAKIGDTIENLKTAAEGENHEYTKMYPEFATIAREEGFEKIAARFEAIAVAEKHHEERYKKLIAELENGAIFNKKTEVGWICRECGYEHVGNTPPEVCPSCDHPQSYYQVKCELY